MLHWMLWSMTASRLALPLWLLVLTLAMGSESAMAHRLLVFAFAEGPVIEGSAYFAGGAPASGVKVRIEGADGRMLAELVPGADGDFRYRATAPADHRVVVRSGDGHRAEWLVRAAELAPAFGEGVEASLSEADASSESGNTAVQATDPSAMEQAVSVVPERDDLVAGAAAVDPALASALERAVARQIRPLREELAAASARASLRDVLGGIGYILGLAGLALWWRGRRLGPRRSRR